MKKNIRLFICAVALFAFAGAAQAQNNESYLLINAMLKANMGKLVDYKANLERCRQGTLKEEGCEAFEIYQSVLDPTIFLIYELWTTDEAHTIHSTLPHSKVHSEECKGINEPSFKTKVHKVFIK